MITENASENVIKRSTPASFEEVCKRVESACSEHKFGVLGKIDLHEKITSKGLEFEPQCTVFEVCNPEKARNVLAEDLDVSSSLPCRISIYTESGNTVISTLRPTKLLALYENEGSEEEAEEVESTLCSIIDSLAS